MEKLLLATSLVLVIGSGFTQQPDTITQPWIWTSEPPADCPFPKSDALVGIAFTGKHSDYKGLVDIWHPSWASYDKMYSPPADGQCKKMI